MKSLQENTLRVLLSSSQRDDDFIKHILMRMIDINKLSESTLYMIWNAYQNDEAIIELIAAELIWYGKWYSEFDDLSYYDYVDELYSDSDDSDDFYMDKSGACQYKYN